MVIIPWARAAGAPEESTSSPIAGPSSSTSPFIGVFKTSPSTHEQTSSASQSEYIRRVFMNSPTDVALFVDRGSMAGTKQHLFLPFFGGPDDRLALGFVVQLCAREGISATVVKFTKTEGDDASEVSSVAAMKAPHTPYTPVSCYFRSFEPFLRRGETDNNDVPVPPTELCGYGLRTTRHPNAPGI
jgi:hypothetical protein